MSADPYEGARQTIRLMLMAEGLIAGVKHVSVEIQALPWWAWLRRRALVNVGRAIEASVSALVEASEEADQ